MKGVIFNLLEAVATSRWGEDAWDDVLDSSGLTGAYTSIGNYPDEQFMVLLTRLPTPESFDDRLRWFGRSALPLLAARYPEFFVGHTDTRSFLLTINDIVHPEVRKLYPDADVPIFGFGPSAGSDDGEGRPLLISYESVRRLCLLAEGFIMGAGDHYGERVDVTHPECMLRGARRCLIQCVMRAVPVTHVDR